ncbi:hypothetical protein [Nonomuraea sp. NPDC048826]|uniref:hypothetical protein n=1 Tax=Nonomuraea sp. NPDC048826 TaxID=3364347 RepID=UPI00371C471C
MGRVQEDVAWSWQDPAALEANAAGEVTPAQRALIIGPRVRPPYVAWIFLVFLVATEGFFGWLGARDDFLGDGRGLLGALAAMGLIMIVWGWQAVAVVLIHGVPRWRERRRRRRMITALGTGRVAHGVGRVRDGAAQVGQDVIPAPPGAPALPPGDYRFFWLESPAAGRGPLLSARPLNED